MPGSRPLRRTVPPCLAAGWLLLTLFGAGSPARSQGLAAEEAALLMSGEQGGALALESTAVVWRLDGDRVELRVSLELPVADLVASAAEEVRLRWAVYAVDASGVLVASLVRSATADRQRLESSGGAGVRILETLDAPTVPLSIRTLVREVDSSRFGLRTVAVDAAAGPRPFVPRGPEGWIELGAASPGARPAALATARAGDRLELLVPRGVDVDDGSWVLAGPGTGDASEPSPLPVSARESMGQEGDGWRRVAVGIPEDARGSRELRQGSDPPGSGVAVLVLPPEAPGTPAWPEVARASTAERLPEPTTPTGEGRLRAAKAREELIAALLTIADESLDAGAAALRRILDAARETAGGAGLATVVEEGLRLGGEMVQVEGASLTPMLATVDRLYRRCRQDAAHACVRTAQELFSGLLEAAEKRGVSANATLADGWVLLAWWSADGQAYAQARDALRRAARLQPRQASARLALAVLLELNSDHQQAANVLGGLVEDEPGLGEAWLRLGVQYRRLGRRAARETLAEAYRQGPEWVRIVARQELAAFHRDRGELERAEETLRQTIEEFPREEQLRLQLAALLDASQRFAEAGALLDELRDPAEADRASRDRYATLPVAELASVRARVQGAGEERREALRAALERVRR